MTGPERNPNMTRHESMSRRTMLSGIGGGTLAATAGVIGLLALPTRAMATTNLENWLNVKAPPYNAVGDGMTDDTDAWMNAIADASADNPRPQPLFIPPGGYRIVAPLQIPSNTMIVGSNLGLGFGCRLEPEGCAAFEFGNNCTGGGRCFHSSIENLMIRPMGMAPAHIISMQNSYSTRISNVRIHDVQEGLGDAAVVLYGPDDGGTDHSNDILWENLIIRNNSSSPNLAIAAKRNCGTHRFLRPDLEGYDELLDWRGGQLDVVAPYTERAGRYAVFCNGDPDDDEAYLNTYGGTIAAAHSGQALNIRSTARNFNSFGTHWRRNNSDLSTVHFHNLPSEPVTIANFYGIAPNLGPTGQSRFTGVSGWEQYVNFPDLKYTRTENVPSVSVPLRGNIIVSTVNVPGVFPGVHCAKAFMAANSDVTFSACVSDVDTVTVVAHGTSLPATVSGNLRVTCGWG